MTSLVAISGPAGASFSGGNGGLTASNADTTIRFENGTVLRVDDNVTQAAWSPDGSRAAYVNAGNQISTVRYDNGADIVRLTNQSTIERGRPTWFNQLVVFHEKSGNFGTWRLMIASPGRAPVAITPNPTAEDQAVDYLNPDASGDFFAGLVFEQRAEGSSSIFTGRINNDLSLSMTFAVETAADPALSPDGQRVAFVRDGNIHACALANCELTRKTVSGDAGTKDDPVWSPDGTTIAFRYAADSRVATAKADGTQSAAPVKTALVGLPAYQTTRQNAVFRLAGTNRFDTAVKISQGFWSSAADGFGSNSVVLSRSDLFADALGGAALATVKQGPLLLTSPTSLNATTKAEISRVLGNHSDRTVYLLGGTGAISPEVESEVTAMGYQVKRLSGADRFQTAIAIANEITPTPGKILVATGKNFPDALAAGAAAGSLKPDAVVVLSNDSALPTSVSDYLKAKAGTATVYGIGGQGKAAAAGLLGDAKVKSVVGSNRYETARLVATTLLGRDPVVGLATGTNWPDALAGGALMGTVRGALLLTPSNTDSIVEPTRLYLDQMSGRIDNVIIFGASGAINTAIEGKAGSTMSGPAGFTVQHNVDVSFLD